MDVLRSERKADYLAPALDDECVATDAFVTFAGEFRDQFGLRLDCFEELTDVGELVPWY